MTLKQQVKAALAILVPPRHLRSTVRKEVIAALAEIDVMCRNAKPPSGEVRKKLRSLRLSLRKSQDTANELAKLDTRWTLFRLDLNEAMTRCDRQLSKPAGPKRRNADRQQLAVAHPFKVAAALAVIPNDDVGWDEWNRIGMATWRATDGDERGFEAFDSWSAKSSKYNARATAQRWRHFDRSPPERIGAGTLFYEAMAADPDWESKLDSRMELQLRRADSEASRAALFGAHTVDPASKTENIPLGNNELDNRVHAKPNSKQPRDQQPPARSNAEPLTTFKHGDVPAEPMRWLIRNRLPETGAGLLSGQWGMYKTFIELDASAHVMLGWNWTGERVHRQGGVLLLAPEGANSIPLRMAALVEHKIALHKGKLPFDPKRLPFEWTNSCPPLLGIGKADPLPALIATAAAAEERFQREFGLPLVLIWIDTMATAAGWEDEQDNADASRALSVMRNLSTASRTLVAGIDHYGKNIEAGSRGASAKEANSDFVLASIGDPRKVDGSVDNTRLVMRKLRDGPQGLTIPFDAKVVDMGMDRYNEPVTSCVINWDVQRQSRGKKKYSESVVLLGVVLNEVLAANGQMIGDAKMAKYVDVREAFLKAYKPEMKKNSRDERFRKAIQSHVSISVKVSDGIKYLVWLETPL
jgi:hypothetical protein